MKTFHLLRRADVSGVSGVGIVAQGVEFDNGRVALTWLIQPTSVSVYDSLRAVIQIHGHGGRTEIVEHPCVIHKCETTCKQRTAEALARAKRHE